MVAPVAGHLARATGAVPLDDVQHGLLHGRALAHVRQLARQTRVRGVQHAAPDNQRARLAGRHPRLGRRLGLLDDGSAQRNLFAQYLQQPFVDDAVDNALHVVAGQTGLGLAGKVRVVHRELDDRRQPGQGVATPDAGLSLAFGQLFLRSELVDGFGDGALETGHVFATIGRGNRVDKADDLAVVHAGVPLEHDLHGDAVLLSLNLDGDHGGSALRPSFSHLTYSDQPAVVTEAFLRLFFLRLIGKLDGDPWQEKGDDLQSPRHGVKVKVGDVHKARAGLEGDG